MTSTHVALIASAICVALIFWERIASRALLAIVARTVWGQSAATRLRWCAVLRFLPGWLLQGYTRLLRMRSYQELGQMPEALQAARQLLNHMPRATCAWGLVNYAVDVFVCGGCYQEALRAPEAWPDSARMRGRKLFEVDFAIVQINQAEALHNLGLDDRAIETLDAVAPLVRDYPFGLNGLRCLRAWILIHRGQLDAARVELSAVAVEAFPKYAAEVAYTHAALEREAGDLKKALEHAEKGLALARSPSSRRNGTFMVAGVAALTGDDARALSLFDEAVASEYRAQGGDGLLRFAAFLDRKGDHDRAARVRRLAIERDAESIFAVRARKALGDEA